MATTKITVKNNGPLRVEGEIEVVDKDGTPYHLGGRNVISFCGCGLSEKKPFCDGSHKGRFVHDAVAFDLPPVDINT
jgi:CDGSH-type Zn-finger protein